MPRVWVMLFSQHLPQHHVLRVFVCDGLSNEGRGGRDCVLCTVLSWWSVCLSVLS